jgi:hypothetical protein
VDDDDCDIHSHGFNQSMENVTSPSGLQSLTFGHRFNHSMENVNLPSGLQSCVSFSNSMENSENYSLPVSKSSPESSWESQHESMVPWAHCDRSNKLVACSSNVIQPERECDLGGSRQRWTDIDDRDCDKRVPKNRGHGTTKGGKGYPRGDRINSTADARGKGASLRCSTGAKGKRQCQFLIGIEEDNQFRVARRILGAKGKHMRNIAEQTGVKLRLRGRGSKFLEGPKMQESTDDLMLCLSGYESAGYELAKNLVSDLLDEIYSKYKDFCAKAGTPPPALTIQIHEGFREGSR